MSWAFDTTLPFQGVNARVTAKVFRAKSWAKLVPFGRRMERAIEQYALRMGWPREPEGELPF